jgi:hypothetical protein
MVTFIEVNKEIEKNGKFIVKYDGYPGFLIKRENRYNDYQFLFCSDSSAFKCGVSFDKITDHPSITL